MSSWTEVILTATLLENVADEDSLSVWPAIDHVNAWIQESEPRSLVLIPYVESCFAGMFKLLNIERFVKVVHEAPWKWPQQVQLFLRQENDRGFQEVKLDFAPCNRILISAAKDIANVDLTALQRTAPMTISYLDEPLHPASVEQLRQLLKLHGFVKLVHELTRSNYAIEKGIV